ncbi:MAG: hypothetical protein IJE78_01280 [Bacteroidaceae bacterium]|nr:hypothetical protein [Bacteroidaceae bacterium]
MKRILLLITVICTALATAKAQVSVNYDRKTVAAMAGAYATETAAEAYYDEQVKAILKHYNAAEVATAGIFTSKFLDRKALTELGIWSSSTENYYYRRIYNLVSAKIMPKIWTVAGLMLKSPQTAIYWGSYLMKICTEVKSLCMQFESVVTNGKLSFSDIAFLEMNPSVAPLFKLSDSGGIDWETLIDDLTEIPDNFTKENLQADIDDLYNMGVGLATAGTENFMNTLMGGSSFNELFQGKSTAIIHAIEGTYHLYEELDRSVGNTLLQMIGGSENVAGLFNLSNYNMTSWVSDYLNETMGRYYTQRWYIARRDQGSEVLCDYYPPTDDESVINGSEWTRFNTSDANFYPNSSQLEQILCNSEHYAGWSRERVNQLNRQNDGYTYSISYSRYGYIITRGNKQVKKSYAYSIRVTKSWNHVEEVYEDVFDSYSMDINTFRSLLQSRLTEFNDNEEGYTYYIGSDSKQYYQATDETKLKGCESVIVSVTCSDRVTLITGSTQYKCRTCGGSLNAHSKECVMRTTLTENDLDLSELDELEREYRQQITFLQSQIQQLEETNATLIKQIADATVEEAALLRQQYNSNRSRISELEKELDDWQKKLEELTEARTEAESDNITQTDDYYRIPAIMQDCRTAYSLTWNGEGWWSGYTYYREATAPNINGVITFRASISIARKPKYFLGIKIHRAIMQISWELTADYTDTEVVDIITLDTDMNGQEKTRMVNDRLSEIARQYPSCRISTEYVRNEPPATDHSEDTYHLLWSSDRLAITRGIDTRLTKIYADLISLEKMMHYKLSIVDVLRSISPYVNDDSGRRFTLVEQCRRRWLRGAANSLHSIGYNGKYEEEPEYE